jgi:glycosyltransferase involved in cell wall biosynthesis
MFFSVVIPTYNRADILRKALEAYYNQSVKEVDYEIIVVNDGGSDHTAKVVREFKKKHKNIRYLWQKNLGRGPARNKGIKAAKGKVILFGQDDIIPTNDFLYEHQKYHYLYPEENSVVLGFTAWHPELKINNIMKWMVNGSSIFGFFGGHQFAYEKLKGKLLADHNFFYTSNLSLKRSFLKKFPFDPDFEGYGWEDIELGYRMQKEAKMKLFYNSWAVAYHYHPMKETDLPEQMESVGRTAVVFHKKCPELSKVPGFVKSSLFRIIGSWPVVTVLRFIKWLSKDKYHSLYYYTLSKRHFMKGLRQGRKKLKIEKKS